uniref:Uncharacterized protein n=1 Tax=Arundo donax TaxID=35708 RepID=A0A0A9FCH2_ARUDO
MAPYHVHCMSETPLNKSLNN